MIPSRYYSYFYALAVLCLLTVGSGVVSAQTVFTVNSTDDDADSNPGDGSCYTGQQILTGSADECTLRAAIEEANAYSGADTVKFNIDRGAADTDCMIFGEPPIESAQSGDGYCAITPGSALPNITQTPNPRRRRCGKLDDDRNRR